MELLKLREGLDLLHVPHRNITEANTNLVGGSVHMMLGGSPQMKPLESTGKVKLLAITGLQRSPAAPEVPTFAETGFPYMSEVDAWWGLAVPAKTPAAIVARLNRELRDILALPELPAALSKQGIAVVPSSPEEYHALIKADIERWSGVIRAAKITAD